MGCGFPNLDLYAKHKGTPVSLSRLTLLSVVLYVLTVPLACGDSMSPSGPPPLKKNELVTRTISLGGVNTFQVDLRRGYHVRLSILPRQMQDMRWLNVRVYFVDATGSVDMNFSVGTTPGTQDPVLFEIPKSGRYTLVISSPGSAELGYAGEYDLRVGIINTAPEHAKADINAGERVTNEVLDEQDDMDDFKVYAEANAEVNVFIRGEMGSAVDTVVLESTDPSLLYSVMSPGNDSRSNGQASGTVWFDSTGFKRFRVRGLHGHELGRYTLTTYRINRAPEGQNAALTAPSIINSRIDHEGDIDEYTIQGANGGLYNLHLQPLTGSALDTFVVEVQNSVGDIIIRRELLGNTATLDAGATGRFVAYAGTKIRIQGKTSQAHYGDYRLSVVPINPAPETAASELILGVITTESIDIIGDVDLFTVTGTPGQAFNVFIRAKSTTSAEPIAAEMIMDNPIDFQAIQSTNTDTSIYGRAVGRTVLPASGKRTIRVLGLGTTASLWASSMYTGPYEILAVALSDAPEGRSAGVAVGEVVTEAIDPPGDVDEYTFHGTAGQLVNIFMQHTSANPPEGILYTIFGVGSLKPLIGAGGAGGMGGTLRQTNGTGTMILPATGTYHIHVVSQSGGGNGQTSAVPYRFEIFPINTAPETAPTTFAIGTTVTEALDYSGDIDQFKLTGTPGQSAAVCLTMTSTTASYNFYARVKADGTEVAATIHHLSQPAPGCSQTFTFPSSGAVTVQVSGQADPQGIGGSAAQSGGYVLKAEAR